MAIKWPTDDDGHSNLTYQPDKDARAPAPVRARVSPCVRAHACVRAHVSVRARSCVRACVVVLGVLGEGEKGRAGHLHVQSVFVATYFLSRQTEIGRRICDASSCTSCRKPTSYGGQQAKRSSDAPRVMHIKRR